MTPRRAARPRHSDPSPSFRRVACAAWLLCSGIGAAQAQDAPVAPKNFFVPTVSLSETYLRGSGSVDGGGKGEFITRVSPGLSWSSRSGRFQGSANYLLDISQYSRRNGASTLSNTLAATVRGELIEQRAFVDAQASVGQTSISPFGQQSGNDTLQANSNRTEVASVLVSPYLNGSLGGLADYQLRLTGAATRSRSSLVGGSQTRGASALLRSPSSFAVFGWTASAQHLQSIYRNGRTTTNDRLNLELSARPLPDLAVLVNGGSERSDLLDVNGKTYANWGAGLRWTPSPRTNVALQADHRYFGDAHSAIFEYRTPRTVWRYSDTRNTTQGADPNAFNRPFTLFQLYFDQFASIVPDPVQREQAVRDFLRLLGRDPNEVIAGGSLASSVALLRRQDLSVAWSGLRTTLNLQAFATDSRPLDGLAAASTPTTTSPFGRVRQTGVTGSVSYRLTPTAALTAAVSRQSTAGNELQAGNRLTSASLSGSDQLSRYLSLSLSLRYALFTGPVNPYREGAATASLNFRF
jgi:uncharacterized protein (PEP-CTERM system associated)